MTDRRRQILPALFAAVLGACSQLPPPGSGAPPGSSAAFEVREHRSGKFIALVGPKAQHAGPFLGIPGTNFFCLRSFIDRRNGESVDQLYVSDSYNGPERNWDAAHDASGHPLIFIPISQQEITCSSGCSYVEEFAANLPESELRANPNGLSVTFTDPTGGEKTITVSGAQIAAQLTAVAAQRRAVLRAAAAAVETPPSAGVHQAE